MAVNLSPIWGAGAQLFDNSGNVLSGGKIYTYAAGTTTPATTYTSSNGIAANSNPIILNSAGRVPYEIWLTDAVVYKFVLKDSNDVLIATYDNLVGINSNFIAYTMQQEIQTATAGQTVFNLTTMQYQPGTHNLSVFVDGVNQYGPSAQYAYVETDSDTVTFVSGLHVGASVKFTTASPVAGAVTDAQNVSYTPAYGPDAGNATNVQDQLDLINSSGIFGANYIAAGQPANLNGNGKGGFKVGGGTPESTNGMWLSLDGASNWLTHQVSKNENPTESILYSTSAQGYAVSVVGTNQITRLWGSDFQNHWIGNTIYFLRKKFKVLAVLDVDNLTVTELDGSSVTFSSAITEAFNYFYTSGSGLCNVSGTTVTFVSGDPFVPLFFSDWKFTLSGTPYTVASFDSPEQYTLTTAPGNGTNIPFTWQGNINDQLTTVRVQAIQGSNEENFNIMAIAGDNFLGRYYGLNSGFAGSYGKTRPIYIGSGFYTDYSYMYLIGCYPKDVYGTSSQGYVSLGGVQGREGVRVFTPNASTPLANRFETEGAATGIAPAWRARGSDTNVALGLDMQGTGEFRVTQDFTRTLLKATSGTSSVNWLTIGASNSGSPVAVGVDLQSADTDVSLQLTTKGNGDITLATTGTGKVRLGNVVGVGGSPAVTGYIEVKDYSGNVVKLAKIN